MQKEIKIQDRGRGVQAVCRGAGHMKRENRKSSRSQTVKGLNFRPRRTPEGDSELVYRLPRPACHHWFLPSLS